MTFKSLGISVEIATSTDDAMQMLIFQEYDGIISDMERSGQKDAGLQLLNKLRANHLYVPLIYYISEVDEKRGTPPGAFGITKYSDDLLHLVLDILERRRI
jgi:DNA-binding NtrC family response regulator